MIDQQSPPTPAPPARPGRPVRGSTLWRARRVVLGVRLALAVLAVVSGVIAARTEYTDRPVSNLWTVVMLAAIVAILLGGLVWWVEPSIRPASRAQERLRTVGRWTRAALAAGGLALASYWTIVDEEGLARLAMALIAVSPVAYLVLTAIGKVVSPPEWEPPPESAARPPRRRRHELMRAAVAAAREVLVDPATEPGVRRIALTIRPRPPQPGAAAPAELAVWLRNGALSTDGTSLTVTERTGRTYRIPLAGAGGPASYGAATLLVVRESVVTSTQYGRSVPRSRELLCVLDSADRRMVDIELYGWTRSDLVALARAAGLRLDRYAPQERQHAVANLRGRAPTALDVAIPKVTAHRTVRGSSPWRDVPLIITIAVATVAGYFGVAHVLGVVRAELAQPEPWQTIAAGLVGVAMVSVLVFTVRRLGTWHEQRRQAARTRSTDAP